MYNTSALNVWQGEMKKLLGSKIPCVCARRIAAAESDVWNPPMIWYYTHTRICIILFFSTQAWMTWYRRRRAPVTSWNECSVAPVPMFAYWRKMVRRPHFFGARSSAGATFSRPDAHTINGMADTTHAGMCFYVVKNSPGPIICFWCFWRMGDQSEMTEKNWQLHCIILWNCIARVYKVVVQISSQI